MPKKHKRKYGACSLDDVAQALNVSRVRALQLEREAMEKFKKNWHEMFGEACPYFQDSDKNFSLNLREIL